MAHNIACPNPLRHVGNSVYVYTNRFETNSTSDPDGVLHDDGVTFARSGVGTFTLTFPLRSTPYRMEWGDANFLEADADLRAVVSDFTAPTSSSGAIVEITVLQDPDTGTGGQPAAADTDDKTIQVRCEFAKNSEA